MYDHANEIVNQTMFTKYTGCENTDINKPENTCSFGSTSSIGFSCSPPTRLVKKDNISTAAQAKFEKDLREITIAQKVEFVLGHALNKNIASYMTNKSSVEKAFEIIHEQQDADYASSWNAPFDPAVSHRRFPEDYTPMCERIQCTETHIEGTTHFMNYTDKGETWMVFETIFATFFIFNRHRFVVHWLPLSPRHPQNFTLSILSQSGTGGGRIATAVSGIQGSGSP